MKRVLAIVALAGLVLGGPALAQSGRRGDSDRRGDGRGVHADVDRSTSLRRIEEASRGAVSGLADWRRNADSWHADRREGTRRDSAGRDSSWREADLRGRGDRDGRDRDRRDRDRRDADRRDRDRNDWGRNSWGGNSWDRRDRDRNDWDRRDASRDRRDYDHSRDRDRDRDWRSSRHDRWGAAPRRGRDVWVDRRHYRARSVWVSVGVPPVHRHRYRWGVGYRYPYDYRRYVIVDYYNFYLPPPPRNCVWVRHDDGAYLVALATGLIVGLALADNDYYY